MPTINMGKPKKRDKTHNQTVFQSWYNTPEWRNLRKWKIEKDPWCEQCLKEGNKVVATDCHHIKAVTINNDADRALLYDPNNVMSVCRPCHSKLQTEQRREAFNERTRRH